MDNFLLRIENIFRNSASSDELFDAFREAINTKVVDIDLYKILIGNPALSSDEIKLYTEKLAKEIPHQSVNTFMWAASVFENDKENYEKLEEAIKYYQRSFFHEPTNALPLIKLLGLYNFDLDTHANKNIMDFIEHSIASVHQKSQIYFSVADLYKQKGNYLLAAKYLALGEKAAERENNQ